MLWWQHYTHYCSITKIIHYHYHYYYYYVNVTFQTQTHWKSAVNAANRKPVLWCWSSNKLRVQTDLLHWRCIQAAQRLTTFVVRQYEVPCCIASLSIHTQSHAHIYRSTSSLPHYQLYLTAQQPQHNNIHCFWSILQHSQFFLDLHISLSTGTGMKMIRNPGCPGMDSLLDTSHLDTTVLQVWRPKQHRTSNEGEWLVELQKEHRLVNVRCRKMTIDYKSKLPTITTTVHLQWQMMIKAAGRPRT